MVDDYAAHPPTACRIEEGILRSRRFVTVLVVVLLPAGCWSDGGSEAPAASAERDPANLYLAYFTPRRLDAEAVPVSEESVPGPVILVFWLAGVRGESRGHRRTPATLRNLIAPVRSRLLMSSASIQ